MRRRDRKTSAAVDKVDKSVASGAVSDPRIAARSKCKRLARALDQAKDTVGADSSRPHRAGSPGDAAELDRVFQADRDFFERFPRRRHRLRWASKAEIAQYGLLCMKPLKRVAGYRCAIGVRCVAPGIRIRTWLLWPENSDPTDIGEEEAALEFYHAMAVVSAGGKF